MECNDNNQIMCHNMKDIISAIDLRKEVDFSEKIKIPSKYFAYYLEICILIQNSEFDFDDANSLLTDFSNAIESNQNLSHLSYSLLGYAYIKNDQYEEAEKAFAKAISLYTPTVDKPEYTLAKENIKICRSRREPTNEEFIHLSEVLDKLPKSVSVIQKSWVKYIKARQEQKQQKGIQK